VIAWPCVEPCKHFQHALQRCESHVYSSFGTLARSDSDWCQKNDLIVSMVARLGQFDSFEQRLPIHLELATSSSPKIQGLNEHQHSSINVACHCSVDWHIGSSSWSDPQILVFDLTHMWSSLSACNPTWGRSSFNPTCWSYQSNPQIPFALSLSIVTWRLLHFSCSSIHATHRSFSWNLTHASCLLPLKLC